MHRHLTFGTPLNDQKYHKDPRLKTLKTTVYIARLRNLALFISVLRGFLAFLIVNMRSECQMPAHYVVRGLLEGLFVDY